MLNFLKPIPCCEGYYASKNGQIYSQKKGEMKRLIPQNKNMSYPVLSLRNGNKSTTNAIHIYVAKAWIPNPEGLKTVNHKNGDKTDSRVENLEWLSHKDQNKHAEETKLTNHHIRAVCQFEKDGTFIAEYKSLKEAAEQTGLTQSNICQAANGTSITAGSFVWVYKEHNEEKTKFKKRPSGHAKPLDQYTLDGKFVKRFESIKDASLYMNCSEDNIGDACKGRQKTAKGFIWKFSVKIEITNPLLVEIKDWVSLRDFPNYKIAKDGRVYSINSKKLMRTQIENTRETIKIRNKDGKAKWMSIHRLVALAYIPNPQKFTEVNHIDGTPVRGKLNNHVCNLEWSTRSKQMQHAHDNGLIKWKRSILQLDLDGNELKRFDSIKSASRSLKKGDIHSVLRGRAKTAGGFKWRYA